MTHRDRLKTVLRGEVPDCVPASPDISNMIPCRLTGKPFWDIYVHKNPPLWKAHIDAIKAVVRDEIKTDDHPTGKMLAETLEARVTEHLN